MTLPSVGTGPVVVMGFGVTSEAVCRVLGDHGVAFVVFDDHPSPHARRRADLLGVTIAETPTRTGLDAAMSDATAFLPSPGIPDQHPAFSAARTAAVPVCSEFDLARDLDDRPIVAITGTDGKTTVTTLVGACLAASGRVVAIAGNTEVPLVAAIADPEPEVFVVEASSFRLAHTGRFEPTVATWLNFAPDHLDAHPSLDAYEQAKARLWSHLQPGATAVANADDPVVMRHAPPGAVTFASTGPGDYRVEAGRLVGPVGELVAVDELPRQQPHDVANALAAAASAIVAGARPDAVCEVLVGFEGLEHRARTVATIGGVRFVDDAKATTPHATLAALAGQPSAVLIAGGRNKGLDLSVLSEASDHLRAVVAIGESAPEIVAVFDGRCPVVVASSMADAVDEAFRRAAPGDAVVLSPGCTSFDWYGSYAERGEDFIAQVRRLEADAGARR